MYIYVRTSQSSGIDGISCSFLKTAMPVLAQSLRNIFNMSISRGCFPGNWKMRGSLLSTKMAPPKIDLTIDLFLCFL